MTGAERALELVARSWEEAAGGAAGLPSPRDLAALLTSLTPRGHAHWVSVPAHTLEFAKLESLATALADAEVDPEATPMENSEPAPSPFPYSGSGGYDPAMTYQPLDDSCSEEFCGRSRDWGGLNRPQPGGAESSSEWELSRDRALTRGRERAVFEAEGGAGAQWDGGYWNSGSSSDLEARFQEAMALRSPRVHDSHEQEPVPVERASSVGTAGRGRVVSLVDGGTDLLGRSRGTPSDSESESEFEDDGRTIGAAAAPRARLWGQSCMRAPRTTPLAADDDSDAESDAYPDDIDSDVDPDRDSDRDSDRDGRGRGARERSLFLYTPSNA